MNRLCTQQRLGSVHAKKRGPTPKPGPPVHDDLVERSFTAVRLDQLWLTDITEHPSAEGKLYLCAIKDARSRRIVGYSMSERMTAQLAVDALNNAVLSRRPEPPRCTPTAAASSGPTPSSKLCDTTDSPGRGSGRQQITCSGRIGVRAGPSKGRIVDA